MLNLVDNALTYKRTVLMLLLLLVANGIVAYFAIPKEESPDVNFPALYITTTLEGVSAEDSDRLLATPMLREIQNIDGLKDITSTAAEGYTGIMLEFDSGVDIDTVLPDVREKVDSAKADLPADADEPEIIEFNVALFPVLSIALAGDVDESILFEVAEELQDLIESVEEVLEVNIVGKRDDLAEIVIDPNELENHDLTLDEIINLAVNNNRLIAAGSIDTGQGLMSVKVPGLIESEQEILSMPIKRAGEKVITFEDVAWAQLTYSDPTSYARFNNQSTVVLEVSKRIGANLLSMVEKAKALVEQKQSSLPAGLEVTYTMDQSVGVNDSLNSLFNNVVAATLLVIIVAMVALGIRASLLIGINIPASFLIALMVINMLGFTLNIVVFFALILSVGMLVDGAIVVTEYADMRMLQGVSKHKAYSEASKRMAWPIIASTATTLAAFFPLLFWPDIIGEFMVYIPITVLITLSASLVMALIVLPVFGSMFGRPNIQAVNTKRLLVAAEARRYDDIKGVTGAYLRLLKLFVRWPILGLAMAIGALVGSIMLYGQHGKGVEFFPYIEPENAQIDIRARGDLSLDERDAIVRRIEAIALAEPAFEYLTTNVSTSGFDNAAKDLIGRINLKLSHWQSRPKASEILERFRERANVIPGVLIETRIEEGGPPSEADIVFEMQSLDQAALEASVDRIVKSLKDTPELRDVRDSRPLPGIDWEMKVDREEAARFGASVSAVGDMVKMVTNGVTISDYVPEGADDKVDIRLRYPVDARNFDRLLELRLPVEGNSVPLNNFVSFEPKNKQSEIARKNGYYYYSVQANVHAGERVDLMTAKVSELIAAAEVPASVSWAYRGQQEDQAESEQFLMQAFSVAIFIMLVILVTQFNSFSQALLTLSAVIFSSAGVFLGLLARGEAFGIVMSGIGIIALAGIVVNANIIFIDTFNKLRAEGLSAEDAVIQTCAQRFRPVILTAITTIAGLMPMVLEMSVNFIDRTISFGAPSTQWWVQLATAIAGGLAFATLITLLLTPSLLAFGARRQDKKRLKAELRAEQQRLAEQQDEQAEEQLLDQPQQLDAEPATSPTDESDAPDDLAGDSGNKPQPA